MKRINVTFYDEIFEKLEVRTKEKRCGSIAQSVRELIDLALRIEETANNKNGDKSDSDGLSFMVDIMKNNLKWSLEALLIIRQVSKQVSEVESDNPDEMLKQCKEQALNHLKKMFPEEGETVN